MSGSEHPDDVTKAETITGFTQATYGPVPQAGWEISRNPLQRGLTHIGLYSMRDLTIAITSVIVTLVVTLGIQGISGVFNDEPPIQRTLSDPFINFGDVDPDGLPPVEIEDPALSCTPIDPCGPMLAPSPVQVDVIVSSEIYKKIPTDMQLDPFCASRPFGDECDFAGHVRVFEGLLDERQLDYLYNDLGVSAAYDSWKIIKVANWDDLKVNPGDISGDYQVNDDGIGSTLEHVKIYLK